MSSIETLSTATYTVFYYKGYDLHSMVPALYSPAFRKYLDALEFMRYSYI